MHHQKTTAYTPQQNGVAESAIRDDVVNTRTILKAGLPNKFWEDGMHHAATISNVSSHSAVDGKTPMEEWTGRKPNVDKFVAFGVAAWVHVPKELRKKLDATSLKGIIVGFSTDSKAYKVYLLEFGKYVESRDVELNVDEYPGFEHFGDDSGADNSGDRGDSSFNDDEESGEVREPPHRARCRC
jgi:hypothetical protein